MSVEPWSLSSEMLTKNCWNSIINVAPATVYCRGTFTFLTESPRSLRSSNGASELPATPLPAEVRFWNASTNRSFSSIYVFCPCFLLPSKQISWNSSKCSFSLLFFWFSRMALAIGTPPSPARPPAVIPPPASARLKKCRSKNAKKLSKEEHYKKSYTASELPLENF